MSGMRINQVRLGDYCSITSSKRIFESEYVSEGVPFFRSKEIIERESGKVNSVSIFISQKRYDEIKEKFGVPQVGDVLLTSVGTLGIPYVIKENDLFYFKDGNLTWMRDFSPEMNSKYLYYWLRSSFGKQSLIQRAIGSSQAAITIDILKKYQLLLPPIEQQEIIITFLSTYDDLIEKNNRKITILQEQTQEIYKEWFVRFRFPGYETAKFENGLPVGWRLMRTVAIGEIVGGGTPSTTNDEYWGGDIPWLTPADLSNNKRVFVGAGSSNISEIGLKCSSTRLLPENTVLLSSRAPVGYVAIAANPICTNQGFKSVICDESIVKPLYLYYFFKNNRELLENYATGSTFPELSATRLKKVKVLIPNDITQKHFEDAVKPILQTANEIEEQIMLLAQQRDLLLPRLMSGKLEA